MTVSGRMLVIISTYDVLEAMQRTPKRPDSSWADWIAETGSALLAQFKTRPTQATCERLSRADRVSAFLALPRAGDAVLVVV